MNIARTRIAAPLVIALAVVLAPTLTGCSLIQSQTEGLVEGALEEATGTDVDLPSTELPEGFPEDVPLIEGEVAFGVALGNGYNVSVRVDGPEAIDDITAQLEEAGFEAQVGGTTGEGATQSYSNADYTVLVVITKEDETSYLANYTVAPVAK
jgi:hypothetical protein